MRVSYFTPTRRRCGIADYSRFLLAHLRKRVDVRVFACERLARSADYARLGRRMNAAGDVAHIQYEHGFFLAGDAPAENFAALMSAIRIPSLLTMHCPPLRQPLWQRQLRQPTTSYLVHSRDLAVALRRGGARGRVSALPHPATPRQPTALSAAAFRRRHGLARQTVLAIFGFTKRHKGYELALEALSRLDPENVLLIAGGPQDEADEHLVAALWRRADELGVRARVRITGYLPPAHVGAALAASDVVLAPFTTMTASGSLATAIAWERPLVASDLRPNADLRREFACLELFRSGDVRDLTRAIQRLLADAELRRRGRLEARRYRRECGYRELAAHTGTLYERLLAGGGSGT